MPSGRRKGPENSSSTVLEASAGFEGSGVDVSEGPFVGEGAGAGRPAGSPGGWSIPASRLIAATLGLAVGDAGFHGKVFSSK
eukprot:5187192-Pleurochrysis_carterae.AAC.1